MYIIFNFIFFVVAMILLQIGNTNAQALVLPSSSRQTVGEGKCSMRRLDIASKYWRATKGASVELNAIQPFDDSYEWKFKWIATNAEITKGQETSQVTIKLGSRKTSGFSNVEGFAKVELVAYSANYDGCRITSDITIFIGRRGMTEVNGFAKVDDLTLSSSLLKPACRGEDDQIVDVHTLASDPENDVLWYDYRVTAGEIMGSGAKVKWNLRSAAAGEYYLSVGVDDGNGIRTNTRTAKIVLLPCVN